MGCREWPTQVNDPKHQEQEYISCDSTRNADKEAAPCKPPSGRTYQYDNVFPDKEGLRR